ncbi:MAG: GHKL domain-containing protein [Alistipes sp.]|nr:GHKL domain-containing protein [Alistipes sp.]
MFDFNNILTVLFLFAEMIVLLRFLSRLFEENDFRKYILMVVLVYRYFTFDQWTFAYISMFLCVLLCSLTAVKSLGYREIIISAGYPIINVMMLFLFRLVNNNVSQKYFVMFFFTIVIIVTETIISNVFFSMAELMGKMKKTEIQHDFNNHLSMIAILAKQSKNKELVDYVKKMSDDSNWEFLRITGNEKLDVILGKKLIDAKKCDIHIETDITVPSDLELDIFDMTVLIGNAFDNAIHAVNELSRQDKRIYFKMKYNCNRLLIEMRNKYRIRGSRGTGMKQMETVVKKYNGLINFDYLEKEFSLRLILYLE